MGVLGNVIVTTDPAATTELSPTVTPPTAVAAFHSAIIGSEFGDDRRPHLTQ